MEAIRAFFSKKRRNMTDELYFRLLAVRPDLVNYDNGSHFEITELPLRCKICRMCILVLDFCELFILLSTILVVLSQ